MREQLGFLLQITGAAIAALGLIVTWWQWSQRRRTATEALLQLVTRRTSSPKVVQLEAALSGEFAVSATAFVTRTGTPLEERLAAIEADYGNLAVRLTHLATDLDLAAASVDRARQDAMAYTDKRLDDVVNDAAAALARATLSGIWVAIAGLLLGLAGLLCTGLPATGP